MSSTASARKRAGYMEGAVSMIVNTLLFVVKYYYGMIFNSIAVIADSVHTLSDSLTSAVVVMGFWVAYKPPDEEHPLGHGRAEAVASAVIGAMLVMVGVDFLQRSYSKLVAREGLIPSMALVWVLAASAAIKEALASWAMALGRRYRAQSLVADAWHHRSDAIASALLALAIAFGGSLWWLDGALGIAMSAMIVYVAAQLVVESGRELMGRGPTREELRRLEEVVRGASRRVSDLHHVHVHRYGEHVEATLHVRMEPSATLEEAHAEATRIEEAIRRELGWEATVHVEPRRRDEERGNR
ncbi:MAG: cation diffusion facilitator family transporter [Desulfurococcaceae archaeon]